MSQDANFVREIPESILPIEEQDNKQNIYNNNSDDIAVLSKYMHLLSESSNK